MNPDSELYHFGIKKMKWGVNRYQTKNGQWTDEGLARRREREGFGGDDDDRTKNGKYSKEQIINSGNAKLVSKYRADLTTDELRAAVNRIDTEVKLNNLLKAKEKNEKYGRYLTAAKVLGAAAKGLNNLINWTITPAGKMLINSLNGKSQWDALVTRKMKAGDYDWMKSHFDSMSVSQQKAAIEAMGVRERFMNRQFNSDKDKNRNNKNYNN